MEEKRITSIVKIFSSELELDASDRVLLLEARKAIDNAYAPYSGFHVGCALRLSNGTLITGSNQENKAFPSGLCAERVAVFSAGAQWPGLTITSLAISARSDHELLDQPVLSCGACLQSISEYEMRQHEPIRFVLQGQQGEVWIAEGTETFLPFQFKAQLKK